MIHVFPLNDAKPHETDGLPCWCEPRIQLYAGDAICIHNAADGREFFEAEVQAFLAGAAENHEQKGN